VSERAPSYDGTTEELTVERPEGTRFAVTLARAAEPSAPMVLVSPAMGMPAGYYVRLVEALAGAGVHGAVMEQRGHEVAGGRRPSRSYDFGYADLVADVGSALDALAAAVPGAPAYVLGHSLGGQVATVYAATHPERLAGLVLVASGTIHWRVWSAKHLLMTQSIATLARVVGHYPGERVGFAGREARGVMTDWARLARTGHLRFGPAGGAKVDHDPALRRLALPVLSISIEGDTLTPRRSADGLVAKLPAADLTRVHLEPEVERIDHFRWARVPEVVLPTILGWLGAHG
jgi:predicted alpha/beta hydrolase